MAENVAWLRREAADSAERAGMSATRVGDVRLAVTEAVANVVLHAYKGRASGLVVVEAEVVGRHLDVKVQDAGGGLRPRPRDRVRYGMTLIAAVCDVAITNPNGGGVCIVMRFALDDNTDRTPAV